MSLFSRKVQLIDSLFHQSLKAFCYYRMHKTGGVDTRFNEMRKKFFNFLGFWIFQMLWIWLVSLPVVFLNSPRVSQPEDGGRDVEFGAATDIIGIIFWVIGILIESIADIQKVGRILNFMIKCHL